VFPILDVAIRVMFAGVIVVIVVHTLQRAWTLARRWIS
jgi:hypothetical protein